MGADPDGVILEVGAGGLSEAGATGGVGLPEIALPAELEMDDTERRELLVNPSDLQDIGDPESGDVGVPGGFAAGGEMGEGGRDHSGDDPWGGELNVPAANFRGDAGVGGTGTVESEMEEEEERLEFEEEKT